jgi:hypothetical protein
MSENINNREYRKNVIKQVIRELHEGKTVEEVKHKFEEAFAGVSASEISEAEQALINEGLPVSEVQRLCDVHSAVFKGSIEEIHRETDPMKIPGHPANVLYLENRRLERIIEEKIKPYLEKGKESLEAIQNGLEELSVIDIHYSKKENLLFPYMEKYGITAPPKVMWGVDDENGINQYIGMPGQTEELTWMKQTIANEMLAGFMKNNEESIEKNKELVKKYTDDVKYFGKYIEDGKTLLRLQYILSGDIYKEMFADFSEVVPEPATEEEAMALEMIQNIANIDIGNLTYIVYIDEASGEMVKLEMDLAEMVASMVSGMAEITGMPPEAMEVLNSLKAYMTVEFLNINSAEDFEIPEEALNAPDMLEGLQQQLETEIEIEFEAEEEL